LAMRDKVNPSFWTTELGCWKPLRHCVSSARKSCRLGLKRRKWGR
jgi:hypothetical protein